MVKPVDIDSKLKEANQRLKAARMGVSLIRRNDKLYLRSSQLPPKPGSDRSGPYRQEIALGCNANVQGLKLAESQAYIIGGQLSSRSFDWLPWLKEKPAETIGEWIPKLKEEVMKNAGETTWTTDYQPVLNKLPQGDKLTTWLLRKAIAQTQPDTRTRKRTVMVCGRLAKLAGLEDVNFSKLAGKYGISLATKRDLPSDEKILQCYEYLKKSAQRWSYGILATYGLRPHELYHLDLENYSGDILRVGKDTKTGTRLVWPVYPEWVEHFNLKQVQPLVSNAKNNIYKGQLISKFFNRHEIPFHPYDLRHSYAIRCILAGIGTDMAAKLMGHSLQVHVETYQHWLNEEHHQKAYQQYLNKTNGLQ